MTTSQARADRQAYGDADPGQAGLCFQVQLVVHAHDRQAMVSGEAFDFCEVDRMHAPTGLLRIDPQADREQPAGPQQGDQLAEGPGTIGRLHMHPDCAEQDGIG